MTVKFGMAKFAELFVMPKVAIMATAEAFMMTKDLFVLQMRFAVMQAAMMTKSAMRTKVATMAKSARPNMSPIPGLTQ